LGIHVNLFVDLIITLGNRIVFCGLNWNSRSAARCAIMEEGGERRGRFGWQAYVTHPAQLPKQRGAHDKTKSEIGEVGSTKFLPAMGYGVSAV
jgi:hypothetical protein